MTTLSISDTVTSISSGAFAYSRSLETIVVDQNNNTYDSRNNCNAIIATDTNVLKVGCKNTIIPDTVVTIGSNAFQGCTNLTNITIPNSVTSIESKAFNECTGLTNITIPNSVTSISTGTGSGSFLNCTNLLTVTVDSNPLVSKSYYRTSVGNICSQFGLQVTTYILGPHVTTIGEYAFANGKFTQITIPDSVTNIEYQAFYSCKQLESINIPSSVTSIDSEAFRAVSAITSISVDPNNTVYDSRDNCDAIIETSTNKLVLGCVNTFPLPSTVTYINKFAFNRCAGLTTVTIPNTITDIEASAFFDCQDLTTFIIDSNSVISKNRTYYGIPECIGS
jgi:hypothetical protein